MGPAFQKEVLGGQNKNPHILVLDSVGCQYRCWFCYARDILDAVNLTPPDSGWKTYRFMTPQDIAACTECKLTVKYPEIRSIRPFARFRITGGEPLYATEKTLKETGGKEPFEAAFSFWLETFRTLNQLVRKLKENESIKILTYREFAERGRIVNTSVSTWLTQVPGSIEVRFDTNGCLFSTKDSYAEGFVKSVHRLHRAGELDSIRVNIDYSVKGPTPIEFEWSQSRCLPVDVSKIKESFDINDHPQYQGIRRLTQSLAEIYRIDETFEESLRMDVERGINFTDTTKYGTRKLGVLYDSAALDWKVFEKKAKITFSEVNNPIQLSGQAKRSKYIKDHLRMGAEVVIINANTRQQILRFDPFPDDQKDWEEYERRIREHLEKANKLIIDGVAAARKTDKHGVQVIIRPIKRRMPRFPPEQKMIDSF